MGMILLLDIGSTYTKAVIVEAHDGSLRARGSAPTTIVTGVLEGVTAAVEDATGEPLDRRAFSTIRACSSAAGGLRIVAIGLTDTLTAHAARLAALGAGGKVVGVYAGVLTSEHLAQVEQHAPDVILLVGGTDGGDREGIVHNAHGLAQSGIRCPVVAAGNREAQGEVARLLRMKIPLTIVDNVLPAPHELNLGPAREAIRQVFAWHIVEAKGLNAVQEMAGTIVPTPSAVLAAAELLADGGGGGRGWGDLVLVDVGGATTDVHSVATGDSSRRNVVIDLDGEPRVKRTVEGDLGMRVSARAVLETAGLRAVSEKAGLNGNAGALQAAVERLWREVHHTPQSGFELQVDLGLGRAAVSAAVERHVGRLVQEDGSSFTIQRGKDLSEVRHVIGTGGVFARHPEAALILQEATSGSPNPRLLKPYRPNLWLDREYLLWACGLLREGREDLAYRLADRSLQSAMDLGLRISDCGLRQGHSARIGVD